LIEISGLGRRFNYQVQKKVIKCFQSYQLGKNSIFIKFDAKPIISGEVFIKLSRLILNVWIPFWQGLSANLGQLRIMMIFFN